jgi:hypothetical protein
MRRLRLLSFWFLLILSHAFVAAAQQSDEPLAYGFVSPNTREDLKITDALTGMGSAEEADLIRQANNLRCVARTKVYAYRALGSWIDGAEHSVLIRIRTQEPTVRYLLSRMGRDTRQKSILYFHPQVDGKATIYRLRFGKRLQPSEVARILDQTGIAFRTLVPGKQRTTVYVVDLKREFAKRVRAAAKQLRAQLFSERGKAEFIGADTRSEARTAYETEISNYEKSHPNLPSPCR